MLKNNNLPIILELFKNKEWSSFESVRLCSQAWTNLVYQVIYNQKTYYIRVKKNPYSKLEIYLFEKFYEHEYYFDQATQILICTGLLTDKEFPTDQVTIFKIQRFIAKLQNLELPQEIEVQPFYFDEFLMDLDRNDQQVVLMIKRYIKEYTARGFLGQKCKLAHNDLSSSNILVHKKNQLFCVIDYECASLNLEHWDIFKLAADFDDENQQAILNYYFLAAEVKLSLKEVLAYKFMVSFYTYSWAYVTNLKDPKQHIADYGNKHKQIAQKYYQALINHEHKKYS